MGDTEPTESANTDESTEPAENVFLCGICAKEFHHPASVKVHILYTHTREERLEHITEPLPSVMKKSNYQEDDV